MDDPANDKVSRDPRDAFRLRFEHNVKMIGVTIPIVAALFWVLTRLASADFITVQSATVREAALRAEFEQRMRSQEAINKEKYESLSKRIDDQSDTLKQIYQMLLSERRTR